MEVLIFQIVIFFIILISGYFGNYSRNIVTILLVIFTFIMVFTTKLIPVLLLKYSTSYARGLFQKEIVKSASQDELSLKWLYARGSVLLVSKDSGKLIYMDMA